MRVALVCDLLEERWPSMDLVADMTYDCLKKQGAPLKVSQLRPPMRRRLSSLRGGSLSTARNADRLLNRFFDYPRWLRSQTRNFEIFHVMDHSYAQLVHHLPPERTVVSCHDLDAFKCLLQPREERRSLPFRLMSKRILSGLTKARSILCDSYTVRDELLSHRLAPADRVHVVFHGTHPTCSASPDRRADAEADCLLGPDLDSGYLLHVGSTIPRKNIDFLLYVFAQVRQSVSTLKLVRVGGQLTTAQQNLANELGILDAITVLPFVNREVLASVYRRARLLLLPSSSEGFGLPVVEAMACGCPVIASDIPVLREIGGDTCSFCRLGDISGWSGSVMNLLEMRANSPKAWQERCSLGTTWAKRFTWERSADQCMEIYKQILERS